MAKNRPNQLRIIGGQLRGRKIPFLPMEDLRPTPDRVRETVFNWLQQPIHNAYCLDLFCGSGALGIEAISRGAKQVIAIDSNPQVTEHLKKIASELQLQSYKVKTAKIPSELALEKNVIDIIFLDPPFRKMMVDKCLKWMMKEGFLKQQGLVYLETEAQLELELENHWEVLKEKKAGQICYRLLRFNP